MRSLFFATTAALVIGICPGLVIGAQLSESADLKAITVEAGRSRDGVFTLTGRDSGQQLLVTGRFASGLVKDLTDSVSYEANPAGIVAIDKMGYVSSVKEGEATVRVKGPSGLETTAKFRVTNIASDVPINFVNEVVPIFTRYGCNSGGCHGKSGGQNNFSLSLLGFEGQEDYEYLVKEARGGRRISHSAPDHSLLLRKAAGIMAHGGGKRIEPDSPAYRLLRRWIEQGTPFGNATDPVVTRIEMLPRERILATGSTQQLAVIAHYSDGSTKDVTRLAQFEANVPDMAQISESGLVATKSLAGTVAVMARFQATVDVFRATIPLGIKVASAPPAKNFIDSHVFKQLESLGLPPSEVCDDPTFLRRVTIDVAGRLPTLEETKEFFADKSAERREKLVDRLLAGKDYAYYFGNKWSSVLRNKRHDPKDDLKPTAAFHGWIVDSLHQNKPYDRFVRDILTANGKEIDNPPVTWFREVKEPEAQMEDVAQLFLGQRIQCARCHHHPFEKWSQQDYYGMTAFFTRIGYKAPVKQPKQAKKGPAVKSVTEIFFKEGLARALNPRTGQNVQPTGLGGQPLDIPDKVDPREKLVDWMTSPDNPFFAKTLVNRYWKHFFGRGLVDPEDDMRITNPATNPELLAALEAHFLKNKFDLKNLVRTICTSQTYQLSSLSNKHNGTDKQSYSRYYPRRLNAEVLLDAIDQVTASKTTFAGVPAGTRAVQLPDNAFQSYFLSVFGRPTASSACECERSTDTNLAQLLHLLNSADIQQKVAGGRSALFAKDPRPHEEKIRELYLTALAREPSMQESDLLLALLQRNASNVRVAYEDAIWALINSQEFLFNH